MSIKNVISLLKQKIENKVDLIDSIFNKKKNKFQIDSEEKNG